MLSTHVYFISAPHVRTALAIRLLTLSLNDLWNAHCIQIVVGALRVHYDDDDDDDDTLVLSCQELKQRFAIAALCTVISIA